MDRTLVGLQDQIAIAFESISKHISIAEKLIEIYALCDSTGSEHYTRQLALLDKFNAFYATSSRYKNPAMPHKTELVAPQPNELENITSQLLGKDDFEVLANHMNNCRKRAEEEAKNPPPLVPYVPKPDPYANVPAAPNAADEECISETETVNSVTSIDINDAMSKMSSDKQKKLLAVCHYLASQNIDKHDVGDKRDLLVQRAANRLRNTYIKTNGTSIDLTDYEF